jgi:DNA-binding transcriptional LysR family regulator
MRFDDMRLFAKVAEAKSFTAAARVLGIPKQTLSRRIAELEQHLDVQLLHRTTRRLHLTDVGAAYAERCAELVRLADEAHRELTDSQRRPRGELRITADPLFGEAFLPELVGDYASRWPDVQVDVMLTRRKVDLVAEGFDVAFRVGRIDDPKLAATHLGPARVCYCASPKYVARRGSPETPQELTDHECIAVVSEGESVRWPFRGKRGQLFVTVGGRLRSNSFAIAHRLALAGLGIAIFPEFACVDDLRKGRLVSVLDEWVVEVGGVWLVHARAKFLAARVRTFVELAVDRLGRAAPWVVPPKRRRTR